MVMIGSYLVVVRIYIYLKVDKHEEVLNLTFVLYALSHTVFKDIRYKSLYPFPLSNRSYFRIVYYERNFEPDRLVRAKTGPALSSLRLLK